MDSRALAALLTSLITEIAVTLLLLFPSFTPLTITNSDSSSSSSASSSSSFSSSILHTFSTSEISTTLALLSLTRKRKRLQSEIDADDEEVDDPNGKSHLGIAKNLDSFKGWFRISSTTFEWLSSLLEPLLECRDPIDSPLNLSPDIRLGIGLFRLANGANYAQIAKQFGVSESVVKFCCKQLCRVLCTNFRFWVGFPNPNELQSVSKGFESLTGLPNCCGVIGCTRFSFVKVNENGVKRVGTVAAQIVVDSNSRILSIVAGIRGGKSNSRILKSSSLFKDIESGKLLNSHPIELFGAKIPQYLVGFEGYPLLPWLMVPYESVYPRSVESRFNLKHGMLRFPVRRVFSSLRNWRILSQPIEEEFKLAVAYIGACSILHNVLLMRDDHSTLSDDCREDLMVQKSSWICQDEGFGDTACETEGNLIRSALASKARQNGPKSR
ncbi:Harbinger transposase-derived nuclease domain [Dillenia turbinata]|uniref:Harbinger transposase-derived nuclease domain n=1 Tax=Dillenia turbinata TaxID=194707 RepID=A0AAN8UR42_9MAGN